jgi:hypothetical protein
VSAGEAHRRDDVGDARAAGDERRMPVDHAVPDLAGLVITAVAGVQQRAAQTGRKVVHGGVLEDRTGAVDGGNAQIRHGSGLPVGSFVIGIMLIAQ